MYELSDISKLLSKSIAINTKVDTAHRAYSHATDIFDKRDTVKNVALEFKKNLFDSIDDWHLSIPANDESGSTLLKKILAPYTLFVDTLNEKDTERFTRFVFGENQVEMLEDASIKNNDIDLFKRTLEKSLGRTIREVIVR